MTDEEKKVANYKAVIRYRATTKGQAVFRKALRRYRQSDKSKRSQKFYQQKYRFANPQKNRVRSALRYAVKTGKLLKATAFQCVFCSAQAQQYHHHKGYSDENRLNVIPVCLKCHKD